MATNNLLAKFKSYPDYQSFVDNQVLTDDQLNQLLDHLNYQDRLSRALLTGVGIVCGLNIEYNQSNNEITVGEGVAVTTAGDLLKFTRTTFGAFSVFGDPYVKYEPFIGEESTTLPLWELETDDTPSDVEPLERFSAFDIDRAALLLYLEDYLEEDEDCSSVDCNTQGRQVVRNLRVLLVNKDHLERLNRFDTILTGIDKSAVSMSDELPSHYPERVVLNSLNTQVYSRFVSAYDVSFDDLRKKIEALIQLDIFKEAYVNAAIDIEQVFEHASDTQRGVQYKYDFYIDLSEAYNDLRDSLLEAYSICCPDPNAFPKHVLLGIVESDEPAWRHQFYPSPAHNRDNSLAFLQGKFKRIIHLLRNFDIPAKGGLVITPSRNGCSTMGERAIPYYYDIQGNDERAHNFIEYWKANDAEWIPNYWRVGYPRVEGFEPLNIHLNDHDFYRIEGHLQQDVREVHETILQKQHDHGLAFDVLPVAIGTHADASVVDISKYRMQFEDLQVVLTAWNKEQDCVTKTAAEFFSKFLTGAGNIGKHKDYPGKEVDSGDEPETNIASAESESRISSNTKKGSSTRADIYKRHKKEMEARLMYHRKKGAASITTSGSSGSTGSKYEAKTGYASGSSSTSEMEFLIEGASGGKVKSSSGQSFISKENYQLYGAQLTEFESELQMGVSNYVNMDEGTVGGGLYNTGSLVYLDRSILEKFYEGILNYGNIDPDIRRLAGVAPGKLIGLLTDVEQSRLRDIGNFNTDRLAEYLTAMENLCSEAKTIRKRLEETSQNPDSEINGKPWVNAYFYTLDRILSHCCITDKVKSLYESVLDRQQELLGQFVLNRFIEKHPGAEHKAGVSKGGTFILLYLSDERSTDITSSIAAIKYNASHGTVVGDLCLPYICCSDTPSTTFVFPEQPASLRLPVGYICMPVEENVPNITMSVRPADGTVKAFVGEKELVDVIEDQDGEWIFNPNSVDTSDWEKVIRFTVNDQIVDAELILYEKPRPQFSFEVLEKSLNKEHTEISVRFTNESEPFEKLSFNWFIGNDELINQNADQFRHTFEVKPGQTEEIEVILEASNGPCKERTPDTITIDIPPIRDNDEEDPDEDENGDNDETEKNCHDLTIEKIKRALQLMESELEANPDELSGEFKSYFEEEVRPRYKRIIGEPEQALRGSMDKDIFTFIQEMHFLIQNSIQNQNTDVQREFTLKIYFELILLYFYLQACRDDVIEVANPIDDVANDWPEFTQQMINQYNKAMQMLLEEDPIKEKLDGVRSSMADRFDEEIKMIIENILEQLNNI